MSRTSYVHPRSLHLVLSAFPMTLGAGSSSAATAAEPPSALRQSLATGSP